MSNDSKRLFALIVFAMLWVFTVQIVGDRLGWFPKAKPKPAVVAEVAKEKEKEKDAAVPDVVKPQDAKAQAEIKPAAIGPQADVVKPADLVLGSLSPDSGYRLKAQMKQDGAGVEWLDLAGHEAERVGQKQESKPLRIVKSIPGDEPSFALDSIRLRDPANDTDEEGKIFALAHYRWEVVPGENGKFVRSILGPQTKQEIAQEIVFRAPVGDPAVIVTKTFRLRKGADGLELSLRFESPKAPRKLIWWLDGPRGLPIEGEWYTTMFREVFFGLSKPGTAPQVETRTAAEVVAKLSDPEIFQTLPTKYTGVETQYFAVFLAPDPTPDTDKDRVDDQTVAFVVDENSKEKQKSDISVQMVSREINVGPDHPVVQNFKIFAGEKTTDALAPYGAADLAMYRKTAWYFRIPLASTMAQSVISPLLERIYAFTNFVAHLFGGKKGNYGIAIILLTVTVRLLLFPLSRKQAMSAKKMQDLQPRLKELKEKYKDDKERFTKEQFALFREAKVNPMGGCLLALIQLPIFVGLWQALNNSVALRHASFLWIENLAAPDMLFKFPLKDGVPFLGPYFNLLPFAVVTLMLIQMKLFTPPATTPDQEMSQKMMKVMMVVMSFMFYKVPSGLGLYFITSSSWAICERLLLPKMIKNVPVLLDEEGDGKKLPGGGLNGGGNSGGPKPGGFFDRIRQLAEEAQKDRTVRNGLESNERERNRDRDWDRGGKPRPKPPGRKR
jgi:YidC/Oxa1 family membrane protein insertase